MEEVLSIEDEAEEFLNNANWKLDELRPSIRHNVRLKVPFAFDEVKSSLCFW